MANKRMSDRNVICSFCGRSAAEATNFVSGMDVHICNYCIETAHQVLHENIASENAELRDALPTPSEIKEELDRHVIGQNEAKFALAVAVYNHYKRLLYKQEASDVEIEKSNLLLLGPTGTGKTLLAQTLARLLNVPFAIADATVLTEAGYVGEDVENILVRLYQAANYDVEETEKGIVYIDELDKISRKSGNPSITRDVSGEGVQQALLKMLEGTIAAIPPKGGRKHPEQNLVNINTRNILFICGGAFDGLSDIVKERVGRKNYGFGSEIHSDDELSVSEYMQQAEPEDLLKFGLIPELIGRLPVIAALNELDKEAMLAILQEPKNALIKQYEKLLQMEGVSLHFTEKSLEAIVEKAMTRKTGARSLRSILEDVMQKVMYEVPSANNVEEVLITENTVRGVEDPVYKLKKKNKSA
jgi:ATP-dependent Clp protease ATP-binding subunit ClpX